MEVGAWMLAGAVVFDLIGVGNRKWADILAAFLALGGFLRMLAPSRLGGQLNEWGHDLFQVAGSAASEYDAEWGGLIRGSGLAILITLVTIVWAFRVIPKSTPQAGDAAKKDMTTAWIWLGSAALSVFWVAIPGPLGELLRTVLGFGAGLTGNGAEKLVAFGLTSGGVF